MQGYDIEDLKSIFPVEIQADILRRRLVRELDRKDLIRLYSRINKIQDETERNVLRYVFQGDGIWIDKIEADLNDYDSTPDGLMDVLIHQNEYVFLYILISNWKVDLSDNELLCWAIENDRIELVRKILQDPSFDPSARCPGGEYPIVQASDPYKQGIVELLLQDKRIDPSVEDNIAIIFAVEESLADMVELLLQHPKVDPSAKHNDVLIRAVYNYDLRIVQILLQDPRVDPSDRNNEALMLAVADSKLEIVKLLLQHPKVDPSARNNQAIIDAVHSVDPVMVKLLLQDPRVDPSDQDNQALISAVGNSNITIVKLLLQYPKVDPSARNNEAIVLAVRNSDSQMVKLLLQYPKVDPSARDNEAMLIAVRNSNIAMVKLLLQDPRVDPSARNNEAILLGVRQSYPEIARLLLHDPRVDPSTRDNVAIVLAVDKPDSAMVRLLLQDSRVDPSARDGEPLIRAIRKLKEHKWETIRDERIRGVAAETAKLLIRDPRTDPSLRDNEAIVQACGVNNVEIVKLLLQDPRVDPSVRDDQALFETTDHQIIEVLLRDPRVDPSARDNKLITDRRNIQLTSLILSHPGFDITRNTKRVVYDLPLENDTLKALLENQSFDPSPYADYLGSKVVSSNSILMLRLLLSDQRINTEDNLEKMFEQALSRSDRATKLIASQPNFDPNYVDVQKLVNSDIPEWFVSMLNTATKNEILYEAVKVGRLYNLELILQDQDPELDTSSPLVLACQLDRQRSAELLLEDRRTHASINDNEPIKTASERSNAEMVKMLLPYIRIAKAYNGDPIGWAVDNNLLTVVKVSIDVGYDPTEDDNYAIRSACENGFLEIAELLLGIPEVDPSSDADYAIQKAAENGHSKIVRLLVQDSRVDPTAANNLAIRISYDRLMENPKLIKYRNVVRILYKDNRVRKSLTAEQRKKYNV